MKSNEIVFEKGEMKLPKS